MFAKKYFRSASKYLERPNKVEHFRAPRAKKCDTACCDGSTIASVHLFLSPWSRFVFGAHKLGRRSVECFLVLGAAKIISDALEDGFGRSFCIHIHSTSRAD